MNSQESDWWKWREDAIELIMELAGYDTHGLGHLPTTSLSNLCTLIYNAVEMNSAQLQRLETIIDNLSYAIGYEEEFGDPRKRNHNYSTFPKWYYES